MRCEMRSPRKNCRPFAWMCFPWACHTMSKLPLKKDQPACGWERQLSGRGQGRDRIYLRTGVERSFWVATISELFERLSYYAASATLASYLHETLNFGVKQAGSLTGLFGALVWFLAAFGGTLADRLGFRRSLSLAYFTLSCSYFLLGSLGAPWLAPVRNAMPLGVLVTIVLMLPALGIALVKPCVVGTTARASKENVRSIGYSIYYTLVNIGGAAGPYIASWVHQHMRVENVFRVR